MDRSALHPSTSFYIHPGYKIYMKYGYLNYRPAFVLVLERSTKDEFLPWPIPNNMTITYNRLHYLSSGKDVATEKFSAPLCNYCSPNVDLIYLEPGQIEKPIFTFLCKEPVEDFHAKICINEHECQEM